jgi:glycosyltransferase involved in cell wall biosynthesis
MKVLLLTSMYPTPDRPFAGTFVATQAESLRRAGVDVEVQVIARAGRGPRLVQGALKYLAAVPQLRRRVAVGDVDVVHAHYSYPGFVALTQRRAPVVVTYHGDDLLGTPRPGGRRTLVSRLLVVPASRLLTRFVAGSVVQNRRMAALVPARGLRVIPCELDAEMFRPVDRVEARRRLGLDPDRPYLLFAADPRIPHKNFPLAERAAALVRDDVPGATLVTVFREPQQTLALYLSACDVLLFPSFQEGSPNLVRQALACGLPVLASDVGDLRETVADGRDCVVLPLDAVAFARAAVEILRSGRRADPNRTALARFDRQAIAGQLVEVYEDVRNLDRSLVRQLIGAGRGSANSRRRCPAGSEGAGGG